MLFGIKTVPVAAGVQLYGQDSFQLDAYFQRTACARLRIECQPIPANKRIDYQPPPLPVAPASAVLC